MFSVLRRLLRMSDPLTAASRLDDRRAFLRLLADTEITVLAALDGPGLDTATLTKEAALAEMRRIAQVLAASDEWAPLVLEQDAGVRCLPFFSTPRHVEAFCVSYSNACGRVFAWETIVMRGSGLRNLLPFCDRLVLNAASPDEHVLSTQDYEELRAGGDQSGR